jgi:hypothetical protein
MNTNKHKYLEKLDRKKVKIKKVSPPERRRVKRWEGKKVGMS